MPSVNLLPWRVDAAYRQQLLVRRLIGLACFVLLGVLCLGAALLEHHIHQHQKQTAFLQQELTALREPLVRLAMLKRSYQQTLSTLQHILSLSQQKHPPINLLNALPSLQPEGIQLLRLERQVLDVVLTGVSVSQTSLTLFFRQLQNSPLFSKAQLEFAQSSAQKHSQYREFKVRLTLAES